MRCFSLTAGALVLGLLAGCASRTATTSPPSSAGTSAPAGTGTSAPSGTGASAPAQARLTPENLEELMKKIGPTYDSLVKHLQANDTAESAKEAQQLGEWFGGVEKFWAQRNRSDAVQWAELARTRASDAAGAAVTGNADKATAAASNLSAACKQCHAAYREPDGAGGYRIKPGVISAQ